MSAVDAFVTFVERALLPAPARRFAALAPSKQGQRKILEALCHEFEPAVRPTATRQTVEASLMDEPCFMFRDGDGFGVEFATVRRAYDHLSLVDGWLILLLDGSAGIYRPEARWDREQMIKPDPGRS